MPLLSSKREVLHHNWVFCHLHLRNCPFARLVSMVSLKYHAYRSFYLAHLMFCEVSLEFMADDELKKLSILRTELTKSYSSFTPICWMRITYIFRKNIRHVLVWNFGLLQRHHGHSSLSLSWILFSKLVIDFGLHPSILCKLPHL